MNPERKHVISRLALKCCWDYRLIFNCLVFGTPYWRWNIKNIQYKDNNHNIINAIQYLNYVQQKGKNVNMAQTGKLYYRVSKKKWCIRKSGFMAIIFIFDYLYPQLCSMHLKTTRKRRKISGQTLLGIHLELRYSSFSLAAKS